MIIVLVGCSALLLGILTGLGLARLGDRVAANCVAASAPSALPARPATDVAAGGTNGVESQQLLQSQDLEPTLAHIRIDPLTGLANRTAFEEDLCRRLAQWRRKQTPLAVMRLDIDHFQRVNAEHGHEAGNAVLRGVALVLRGSLREMDLVARLGRDEFAVILPSTMAQEAAVAGKRVRAEIAAATFHHGQLPLKATVSVGLAEAVDADHAALLLERADAALHAAKRGGRNTVHIYTKRGLKPIPAFEPEGFLPGDAQTGTGE